MSRFCRMRYMCTKDRTMPSSAWRAEASSIDPVAFVNRENACVFHTCQLQLSVVVSNVDGLCRSVHGMPNNAAISSDSRESSLSSVMRTWGRNFPRR